MAVSIRTGLIWLSTAALAVVGGLLGSQFWDLGPLKVLFVIVVSGFFGVLIVLGWITRSPQPEPVTPAPTVPPHFAQPSAVRQVPALQERRDVVSETQWWEKSATPAPVARTAPQHPEFDARPAQIAQCPRCASFELDSCRVEQGYTFRCRNPGCGNTWDWVPGTAWPALVVRRNLSGRPPG